MAWLPWIGFLIALTIIMVLSKKELALGLAVGAFIFAVITQTPLDKSLLEVLTDISTIFLLFIVALIPILGGIMEESGLMIESIKNLDVSKKVSMIFTPALFGLLPVAGGALMSAPIINQIDDQQKIPKGKLVTINVWYRHIVTLVYPLSSELLLISEITNLSLYTQISVLIIPFTLMILFGYMFLIRPLNLITHKGSRNLKQAFYNMIPIIIAPLFDLLGRIIFPQFPYPRIFLLIGLILSIGVAIQISSLTWNAIKTNINRMKIWRFPAMIFAIFWFLVIFNQSGIPEDISGLNLPFIAFIFLGFFFGFTTGRTSLPATLLMPVYLTQIGLLSFPLLEFGMLYFSIFLGYLITPVHPCVAYSNEYFKIDYKKTLKYFLMPLLASFLSVFSIYIFGSLLFK